MVIYSNVFKKNRTTIIFCLVIFILVVLVIFGVLVYREYSSGSNDPNNNGNLKNSLNVNSNPQSDQSKNLDNILNNSQGKNISDLSNKITSGGGSSGGGGGSGGGNSGGGNTCSPTLTCANYSMQCGMGYFDGCDNVLDCSNSCESDRYCNETTCLLIDPIFPQFLNTMDNSGINYTKLSNFNTTVTYTNRSVFLNIGGNIYKATNLSANLYNVTINLSAGDYTYFWFSYGNGTRRNYNVSKIRSFSVIGPTIHLDSSWFSGKTAPYLLNQPRSTYILDEDVSTNMTAFIINKPGIVFDLNGHNITFSNDYTPDIPNSNFETTDPSNLTVPGWDISNTYNVSIVPRSVFPMLDNYSLKFVTGNISQGVISDYVNLDGLNRTYVAYAIVVATWRSVVNISVEDENGNIICSVDGNNNDRGGILACSFVTPMIAENYRLIINHTKYINDTSDNCYIDNVGIKPAYNYGIVLAGYSSGPWFPDYVHQNLFGDSNNDTIKNGAVIQGSGKGMYDSGIIAYDTGDGLNVTNMTIISYGINSRNFYSPYGSTVSIHDSTIINRGEYVVNRMDLSNVPVTVGPDSLFYNNFCDGGQGIITLLGDNVWINNNTFKNNEHVTNHYSINCYGAKGGNDTISNNIFEPYDGGGVLLSSGTKNCDVFNNTFNISSSPCDSEYLTSFSTNAIRITDYDSSPGKNNSAYGNNIFNNKFYVFSKSYPDMPYCTPKTYGIFYSVGGGDNNIFNNQFYSTTTDNLSKAYPFFVGSSNNGGIYENNYVESNSAFGWLSNDYGHAANARFINNTFNKTGDIINTGHCDGSEAFQIGYCCGFYADNITFLNNHYFNQDQYKICYNSNNLDYFKQMQFVWNVNFYVTSSGSPVQNAVININSVLGENDIAYSDSDGTAEIEILDRNESGLMWDTKPNVSITYHNPYNISVSYSGKIYSTLINVNSTKYIYVDMNNGDITIVNS